MGENIVSSVVLTRVFSDGIGGCEPSPGKSGNDGEDWKCRRVPGRPNPGVGGIASLISWGGALVLPPGVSNVRPRLLGFLFGGVGGFTKVGEPTIAKFSCMPVGSGRGRLVVEEARPGVRVVLTARFFRFRPFFGGSCFCNSKNGLLSSEVRGRSIPTVNVDGGGDSGEDPGDGSVALESSTREIVVVGEESLDVVADESLKLW